MPPGEDVTDVQKARRKTLGDLDEDERYARFDQLQQRLPTVWSTLGHDVENESVVVIPSMSVEDVEAFIGNKSQAYEERFLYLLLLLRQPRLRMIYVTSMPIQPAIIEYYLALLPGVVPSHARARLDLVSIGDSSPRPLSEKLLERPRLLRRIAHLIPDTTRSHLVPFNTTPLERDIALSLGIPMYGADPRLSEWGTKTGCRRLFAEEGVGQPLGAEDLHTLAEVRDAVVSMRQQRPSIAAAILKLNEGVSGGGNALVDLTDLPAPGATTEPDRILERLHAMHFEMTDMAFDWYVSRLAERGGVIEELVSGTDVRSPSVQLRILPSGRVELLSTHDQLLGGPSGQTYLGAKFPADPAYAQSIAKEAEKVGARLGREGVLGRFAVDFVTVCNSSGAWIPYAIEINLRKGGTTHPFLTLQFLTDGYYEANVGLFRTPLGQEKYLVATDRLQSPVLRGLTLDDLFDIVARHRLHFDQARQTGVVFHMLSALTEHGMIGMTAIGDSPTDAEQGYRRAEKILLDEAQAALADAPTVV
jgi:hypothetical protein